LLGSGVLSPSLQGNIVGTLALSNSLEWKSWSDIEWSVDMETELFIHSLSVNLISFIYIDYLPLLISSSFVL
jgi:hypothetical protein